MVNCGQGPWERCSARQSLVPSTAPKGRPQGTAQPKAELGAPSFPVLIVPVNWQLMLCIQSSTTAQLGGVRQSLAQLQDKPQLCPLPPVLAHTPTQLHAAQFGNQNAPSHSLSRLVPASFPSRPDLPAAPPSASFALLLFFSLPHLSI